MGHIGQVQPERIAVNTKSTSLIHQRSLLFFISVVYFYIIIKFDSHRQSEIVKVKRLLLTIFVQI